MGPAGGAFVGFVVGGGDGEGGGGGLAGGDAIVFALLDVLAGSSGDGALSEVRDFRR